MSLQARFTVYNASAGSGKTFQIALQYLSKILRSDDRSYIYRLLGITFTNKAAEEMKKRIIDSLIQASQGDFTGVMQAVSEALRNEIDIQDDEAYRQELIKRSRQRLFEILHYYDEFQLTTIDKLMYKIIRTFARDMHLPADVGVELEYKEIVNNLIDKLINQAKKGSLLSKVLIDMSKRKIDDEKSWDIKVDLAQISGIIFDDNYFDEIKSLEDKSLEDFQKLKKLLYAKREQLHKTLVKKHAKNLSDIIKRHGNNVHKNYKPRIEKFLSHPDEFHKIGVLSTPMLKNVETQARFFNKDYYSNHDVQVEDNAMKEFFMEFHPFQFYYKLYTSLINNINSLSILNELNREIEEFKAENNSVFIHDFNKLIAERLLEDLSSDTPYIFMRLGEKYAHFFIDEFQDTSALQWQNLIPLLKESLSKEFSNGEAGTSMIVGDAKQSIYRFRGGKPEQFIALSHPEDNSPEGNPFAMITGKKVENLAYNWRSKANIIRFNNAFFSTFPDYLNETYRRVYEREKVAQKIPPGKDRDEGFVQVRFYSTKDTDEHIKEDYTELVLDNVLQAQKNGFRLDEICILTDKNDIGKEISATLINQGIEVVSSESLLVASAGKVKLLLSVIKYLETGKSHDIFEAVRYVARKNQLDEPEVYARFFKDKNLSKQAFLEQFAAYGYSLDYDKMMQFNLYDLVVYLTDIFRLTEDDWEYAYLQTFLEKIYEFQSRFESNLRAFLSEWAEVEGSLSINAPEKENAVRIMTVHKSKGLEFPVVIYYSRAILFDAKLDGKKNTWIGVNPSEFAGFKYLPVQINTLAKSTVPEYTEVYERVTSEKKFDSINRLYVAFTRAVEQLYVVVPYASGGKQIPYARILNNFLEKTDYQVKEGLYQYGNPKRLSLPGQFVSTGEYIDDLRYKLWYLQEHKSIKINTQTYERWQESKRKAIAYGMQLHDILARIETREQWQRQKSKLLAGLSEEDKALVEQHIEKLINHPGMQAYFSDDYRVLNEQSILIPAGEAGFSQRRPDRLLLKDNKVVIIDYKTGEKHNYHRQQLEEYASLLEEAGYQPAEKILVYFDKDGVEVEQV